MKGMARAKSFVAPRSSKRQVNLANLTATENIKEEEDDDKGMHLGLPTLPQRSNSVCGPHAARMANVVEEAMLKEHGPSMTRKSRLKAKAKVLIQLQSMRTHCHAIDTKLHDLQEMSDRCQRERIKVPRMRNCSNVLSTSGASSSTSTASVSSSSAASNLKTAGSSNCCCEHDAIMNQVVDIETHVKIVRNSLLFLCRSYLLEKQIAILLSVQEQMFPTFDISVRFFGIDWIHIFRVSYNLIQSVDLMCDNLKGTSTAYTDVLLPSNIIRALCTIEADVNAHAEAVLHGRLSKIAQEKIRVEEQKTSEIKSKSDLAASATSTTAATAVANGGLGPIISPAELSQSEDILEPKTKGQLMADDVKRTLRRALRLPSIYRHQKSRNSAEIGLFSDKNARSHHEALWRAWYIGLQTITIPAFSMPSVVATPTTASVNSTKGDQPAQTQSAIEMHDLAKDTRESRTACSTTSLNTNTSSQPASVSASASVSISASSEVHQQQVGGSNGSPVLVGDILKHNVASATDNCDKNFEVVEAVEDAIQEETLGDSDEDSVYEDPLSSMVMIDDEDGACTQAVVEAKNPSIGEEVDTDVDTGGSRKSNLAFSSSHFETAAAVKVSEVEESGDIREAVDVDGSQMAPRTPPTNEAVVVNDDASTSVGISEKQTENNNSNFDLGGDLNNVPPLPSMPSLAVTAATSPSCSEVLHVIEVDVEATSQEVDSTHHLHPQPHQDDCSNADESFDSLTLTTAMVVAPRQSCSESQL